MEFQLERKLELGCVGKSSEGFSPEDPMAAISLCRGDQPSAQCLLEGPCGVDSRIGRFEKLNFPLLFDHIRKLSNRCVHIFTVSWTPRL